MVRGGEFHDILYNVFQDVRNLHESEQLQVCCPRCQEQEGLSYPDGKYNLEINTAKRMFRCWKCDEPKFSGSLGRLIRTFGGFTDYELYKSYASVFKDYDGVEDEREIVQVHLPEEMIYFSKMDVNDADHFEAYNYLINERQLTREIIFKYRLGFCTTGKHAGRIIIPSFDAVGEVNYFVGRAYKKDLKQKFMNPKVDKGDFIFNEGYVNWDSTIYLVEGAFEMFSVINGIPLLGKDLLGALFFKLKELQPNVVVLMDPDAFKSSIELFYKLHSIYVGNEERIKVVKLPTDDDLDELRVKVGHDAVLKALYSARGLTVDDYFVNKLSKPYDKRARRSDAYSTYFGQR